jgi:acyl carrier protein
VKVQFGDEPVRSCYFGADEQVAESNRLSDERGRCLPLVPTSQPRYAAESYEAMNRPVTQENTKSIIKQASTPGPARSRMVDVPNIVQKTVEELLGTVVPNDAPLMGVGLDSIATVDLVSTLSQRLGIELKPTALFDYPTIGSLSNYLAAQVEPEQEHRPSPVRPNGSSASSNHWILYSEIQVAKNVVLPLASKSARRVVIMFAFPFSGLKICLSNFSMHPHLCVCEDLCLLPFETLGERKMVLSKDEGHDGLTDAVKGLRNCSGHSEADRFFTSVANAYRALQEWCAPRILVDGTEGYTAMPRQPSIEAKNLFMSANFLHLLRNPRECLGEL